MPRALHSPAGSRKLLNMKKKCPKCGLSTDGKNPEYRQDCCANRGCEWITCPICSQCVSFMVEDESANNPCKHVVAWDSCGDRVVWEDPKYEAEYKRYLERNGFTERDSDPQSFIEETGFEKRTLVSPGSHGSSFVAFYFVERPQGKKSAPTQKTGRPRSARR